MMFYSVKSHQKFKILDTFNELLCYCHFALRPSSCIVNIGIFRQSAVLINRLNHNIFLCFDVFGHSLCWSEKLFCLEDVGILHSAGMKICILSTFPAYGKVGVAGVGEGGTRCKREKKGTPATRAASFAFRLLYIFQLSQLSDQRPIRIRCTLFCMTDFTWECIAKGCFVAVEHEKIFATQCRRRDPHKNL